MLTLLLFMSSQKILNASNAEVAEVNNDMKVVCKFKQMNVSKICFDDYCFPRVIWTHWEGNLVDIPEDIQEMLDVSKESLSNFAFQLLSDENIADFLDLKSFPKYFEMLEASTKADYIRVCIIQKCGGVWVDSSTFINSGRAMEEFIFEAYIQKAEMVSFGIKNFSASLNFFGCPENSSLMREFKKDYDKLLNALEPEKAFVEMCEAVNMKRTIINGCYFHHHIDFIFTNLLLKRPDFEKKVVSLPLGRSHYALGGPFVIDPSFRKRLLCDETAKRTPFIKVFHHYRDGKKFNIHKIDKSCE